MQTPALFIVGWMPAIQTAMSMSERKRASVPFWVVSVWHRICAPPNAPAEFRKPQLRLPKTKEDSAKEQEDSEHPITSVVYWLGVLNRIMWADEVCCMLAGSP